MTEQIIALFSDYTFQVVAVGSAVLGIISGALGSFSVLRKQSLLGDGVSHSALAGVALAFLLTESKSIEILLLGALVSGLFSVFFIHAIVRNSRIKFDSALALVMSVLFGLGMVLLTYLQKIPNSNQAGLKSFIFGQASTLLIRDVKLMLAIGIVLLVLLIIFWKEFKLLAFDSEYAEILGFSPQKLNWLLSFMTVVAIVIGLQTVGVILMSAMLIAPAVAARQWTNKLWLMVLLAACFGALAGIVGTTISSTMSKMPTGPSIVLVVSSIVMFSLFFAPERGLVAGLLKKRKLAAQLRGGKQNVTSN